MSRYVLLGSDQTQLGWMLVSPDRRAAVAASATVLRPGREGIIAAAGVSLARRLQSAAFVHDSLGPEADTAIVIANPNTMPVDCQISVTDSGGQSRSTLARSIAPKGHFASSVNQLFSAVPAIDETSGLARIACNRPFAAVALHFSGGVFSDLPVVAGPVERYGFEDTVTGWRPGTYELARAIQTCAPSEREPYSGRFSLVCRVDLNCRSTDRTNGEVEVDLRGHSPSAELVAPLDLDGVRITARVRAPAGAAGSASMPNGWQLYVKDTSFRGFVGSWSNLEPDNWSQIEVTPGRAAPRDGFMTAGFDPASVGILGVKLGCGSGSTTLFAGDILIDVISW
jgi:hypothetical protein